MSSLHRASAIVASLMAVSSAAAACAGSEDEPLSSYSDDAGGADQRAPEISDSGSDTEGGGNDADALIADACTSAGWCSIEVDSRLSFDDLWPLEDAAVAVASRNGRSSVVIYEQGAWKVIHEVPFILTSVWASKTDVWVSGGEAGYVAHGRREGTDWKWTVRPIAVTTPVSVVRGIGEHEIYALADARVWHLEGAGDDWTIDFGGDVPADEAKFVSLVGTSPDDIWVTGVRGSYPPCGVVAHKSAGVWQTVIEGTPDEPSDFGLPSCVAVGSAVPMTATVGVATATAPRELVAITEGFFANSVARIRLQADGGVDIASSPFSYAMWVDKERRSIWGTSSDDLYLAGFSKVNRGHDIFADTSGDAGVWQISTVAFTGIALMKPFHVVRGTRSDNVWLAGESYVFHKTTN